MFALSRMLSVKMFTSKLPGRHDAKEQHHFVHSVSTKLKSRCEI